MATIRRATPEDGDLIVEMLAIAADWRPGARIRAPGRSSPNRHLRTTSTAGVRRTAVGFVAEEVGADTPGAEEILPVGATWWTFFSARSPGTASWTNPYQRSRSGSARPWQGRGIGTLLLESLIAEARRCSLPALSLQCRTRQSCCGPVPASGIHSRRSTGRLADDAATPQSTEVPSVDGC